ncbi:chitin elicitor receptor kinase 1-like isoform X2 [Physcomitrium patens]|uniref:chitin elicitor receptor kinase 1-like isoform X2 n=1 Tax=Physcomitrium patens TaxID=3218 RepID=UPI003CCE1DBD
MTRQESPKSIWPSNSSLLLRILVLQYVFMLTWEVGNAACVPEKGCDAAYAFYRTQVGDTLVKIGTLFQTTNERIGAVNPVITDLNFIDQNVPLYIPFRCDCINDQLLQKFQYQVQATDTIENITAIVYENLTQLNWVTGLNSISDPNYVETDRFLVIPVNCSCGNPTVSSDYGLFLTYPVVAGTGGNLSGIASEFNASEDLVRKLNPNVVWENSQPTQYAFIPTQVASILRTMVKAGKSSSTALIIGVAVGGVALIIIILALLYCFCIYQPMKRQKKLKLGDPFIRSDGNYSGSASEQIHSTSSNPGSASFIPKVLADYTVDKSVEFTYEELAKATDNFSVANKIGQGGFASVYYGVIRGQKLAIKMMNLQATREFMAELQVLTHVHHTNLVQLIGYCTTDYLFLIYEFLENGTLDQHLHSARAAREPLSWSSRVQVALDAARGLEYIHEHTKPTYIHRDIKSANILLDKQFHAKVADFGLTKLTETRAVGSDAVTQSTRVVGTWGYMSPEYARFGEVTPMLDVYSFGVVLFEILSGREAIMRGALTLTEDFSSSNARPKDEQRALVTYFDPVLKYPNGKEKLPRFMDPSLGDNYPLEAAWKMAQLAEACTQEDPTRRPNMRKAVVALMTLSSSTQDWELSSFGRHSGSSTSFSDQRH